MQASKDITAKTTAAIEHVGHVYGRLGQGEATMPGFAGQTAWQWYDQSRYDKGMLVSVLPIDPSQDGLANTEEIHIKAQVVQWANYKEWTIPEYPTDTEDPVKVEIVDPNANIFTELFGIEPATPDTAHASQLQFGLMALGSAAAL